MLQGGRLATTAPNNIAHPVNQHCGLLDGRAHFLVVGCWLLSWGHGCAVWKAPMMTCCHCAFWEVLLEVLCCFMLHKVPWHSAEEMSNGGWKYVQKLTFYVSPLTGWGCFWGFWGLECWHPQLAWYHGGWNWLQGSYVKTHRTQYQNHFHIII